VQDIQTARFVWFVDRHELQKGVVANAPELITGSFFRAADKRVRCYRFTENAKKEGLSVEDQKFRYSKLIAAVLAVLACGGSAPKGGRVDIKRLSERAERVLRVAAATFCISSLEVLDQHGRAVYQTK
jgi:hypothetical protein